MTNASDFEPDPLFVDSLKEAKVILSIWLICFVWTVSVCLSTGYAKEVDPQQFPMILGMPTWIVWGVALPWLLANVVTIVFCLGYMKDADLGEDPPDPEDVSAAGVAGQEAGHVS
ncbi:MAG: DUF997 family protein [Planctomycetaceae bacterium]